MSHSVFPGPAGSAGAAHFSGRDGLARRRRADTLRSRAEGRVAAPEADGATPAASDAIGGRPRPDAACQGGEAEARAPRAVGAGLRPAAPAGGPPEGPRETAALSRAGDAPRRAAPHEGAAAPGSEPDAAPRVGAGDWPRPPACLVAARLGEPPQGARVAVCGLVIVRQRPGSARGVVFVTLEDETGVVNVIVWAKTYERFRRAVIAGRLLRVVGRVQREGAVIHVVAETVEDVSHLLDRLTEADRPFDPALAHADEVRRPQPEGSRPEKASAARRAQGLIRGAQARAFHPRDQAKRLFPRRPCADDGG